MTARALTYRHVARIHTYTNTRMHAHLCTTYTRSDRGRNGGTDREAETEAEIDPATDR